MGTRPRWALLFLVLMLMLLLVNGCTAKSAAPESAAKVDVATTTSKQPAESNSPTVEDQSTGQPEAPPKQGTDAILGGQAEQPKQPQASTGNQQEDVTAKPTAEETQVVIKTKNPVNSADAEAAISEIDKELDRLVQTLEALQDVSDEDLE